ncbi:MAG: capsular polysaccharide biosynthesis protein [Leptospiraceae bacterium]|nr:MAG: capsular polysaccharide biosynthesis protein [Leptospiraceae bacterium]
MIFIYKTVLFAESQILSFSVVGDIMNHDLQIQTAYNKQCDCWDYRFSFEKVKPYLEKADVTIGNLETTLPGDKNKFSGYPKFGAPDELVDALKWSGFDILTLANNHSADKGYDAIIRTRLIVEKKGIIPLGTFYNEEHQQKNSIVIYNKNNFKIALLNFTYGTNGIPVPNPAKINEIDLNFIRDQIHKAKENNPDIIIVLFHYGTEYKTKPDIYQQYLVKIALKEGVDIVLGGHPHVLQPFELLTIKDKYGMKKERLIVWSLGNFVSNQKRINTTGGMIFQFQLIKQNNHIKITNLDYIPVFVDFNQRHYILPINDYIYLSLKKEKNKKLYGLVNWNKKKYHIYFKNNEVKNKFKMISFFRNAIKILQIMPRQMEIR